MLKKIIFLLILCTYFFNYSMQKMTDHIIAQYDYAQIIASYLPLEVNHLIANFFLQLHGKSVHSMLIPRTCKKILSNFAFLHRPVATDDNLFIIQKFTNGYHVYNAETFKFISSSAFRCYDICKRKSFIVYQDNKKLALVLHNIASNFFSNIINLDSPIINLKISPDGCYIAAIKKNHITLYDICNLNNIQSYNINHHITENIFFSENNTLISSSRNNNLTGNIYTWKIDHNTKQIVSKIVLNNTAFNYFLLSPNQYKLTVFVKSGNDIQYGKIFKSDKKGYFSSQILLGAFTKYNKNFIIDALYNTLTIRNTFGNIIHREKTTSDCLKNLTFSLDSRHILLPLQTYTNTNISNHALILHFNDQIKFEKKTYIKSSVLPQGEILKYTLDINKQGLILLQQRFNNFNQPKFLLLYDKEGNSIFKIIITNPSPTRIPHFTVNGRSIIYDADKILHLYDEETEKQLNQLDKTITCQQALFLLNNHYKQKISLQQNSHDYHALESFDQKNKEFLKKILTINEKI